MAAANRLMATHLTMVSPALRGVTRTSITLRIKRATAASCGRFGVLPSEVATALAMVLTEVLQNAVEHGYADAPADGSAGGEIVVTVRRLVGRLHVSVEDDGRGLPDGFELDKSTNLGLSIVREVLSALGGEIHAANRDGGGAVFTIDLPPSAARPASSGPAGH